MKRIHSVKHILYNFPWEKLDGSMVTYTSFPSILGTAPDLETKEILTICWGEGLNEIGYFFSYVIYFAWVHEKNMEEPVHLYISFKIYFCFT